MTPDEVDIDSISRNLGKRLQEGDAEAIKEVFDRLGDAVTRQLKVRFGHTLNESDLEEIVWKALLQIWTYRQRYDPARSSLYTWFYLIARSGALDMIAARAGRRQIYLSELTPAQRGELVAPESEGLQTGVPGASDELVAIETFLAGLEEQDRQIVLAFAEHQGCEPWAADLAEQWQMPASTIRSKKRRVMLRLRDALTDQGFTIPSGEKNMSALAPRPHEPVLAARAPRQNDLLTPQFAGYTFLQENSEKVIQLTTRLRDYLNAVSAPDADPGLSHFSELWNRARAREQLQDSQQRQVLIETYHWLTQRAGRENQYRDRLTAFIDTALLGANLRESSFAREAATQRIERIEAAMAGLGRGIEQLQPEGVIKAGTGKLHARWESADATLSVTVHGSAEILLFASGGVHRISCGHVAHEVADYACPDRRFAA